LLQINVLAVAGALDDAAVMHRDSRVHQIAPKGVYKGRPPSIDAARIAALKAEGLGPTEIAKRMGVGRASVYRLLAA
jgi:DNA invertase Pin-like site-specific DNA recombinase